MDISREHLRLLSNNFKNINETMREIINLEAILSLPKGTEHFLSDIHGEYEAFDHVLRNGSGVIKEKLKEVFGNRLQQKELNLLATIIYYPEEKLNILKKEFTENEYKEYQKILLLRLLEVTQIAARKYTRSKVRKILPSDFSYIIEELLYKMQTRDKADYYEKIVENIIELGAGDKFIIELSLSIHKLIIDHLHIVGDVYDRGPYPDKIMDRLLNYHSVDIQWGNHDMLWIGAYCGDAITMANVLRICARYDNLDIIEDRYGISLRSLLNLSETYYKDDPCKEFMPKLSKNDELKYSEHEIMQIARMHKAIAVIQFKLEKQAIDANPEFNLGSRALLDKINFEKKTVEVRGKTYPMTSCNFPTVDRKNPYKLSKEEEKVVKKLRELFTTSEKLKKHIELFINKGAMYKCYNGNLLIHGCMPVDVNGNFQTFTYRGETYTGKAMLDFFDKKVRSIFYSNDRSGDGLFFYLWQGEYSPLFGKRDMTTFERYFIEDKASHEEVKNAYYKLRDNEAFCIKLLKEFGLSESGHIINGHTPVKETKGENPIKANGRTIVIDGGMSRAYHKTTGHGGYTLTYNSYGLQIMRHDIFQSKKKALKDETDIVSTRRVVDKKVERKTIADTDTGQEIKIQIEQLKVLLDAYKDGTLVER
ncbi:MULTISPECIES: fructose-1,6-bisphosphatase [Gemella]|uniref:fructose-1,6-bisphosphatase n=1 Tax=Gemella TaxID=1378 RepID=UPI000930AB93|nr:MULTISPECIES: fructose-1,6-bisphosphatase [Gemella]AXI26627.1 fructose-bisphosphatase class III [Gemella sp. ND 6198]